MEIVMFILMFVYAFLLYKIYITLDDIKKMMQENKKDDLK